MELTTGVVLAAGEGTRLRPLTRNRPKPLLPAATRPILGHVLDALVEAGLERIVLVVGYRRERVQEVVGHEHRDVPVEYVTQETQLGSGHALLQASETAPGPLLVVNGDHIVTAAAVGAVVEAFDERSTSAAIAITEREDTRRYGAVTVSGDDVERIVEKPEADDYRLINAGIYAFDGSIYDELEATDLVDGELGLTETLARLVERERVGAVRTDDLWVDATYPWDLLSVTETALERGFAPQPETSEGVRVAESARVDDSATLRPPVAVAADAEVGPGAVLGPSVAVGQNTTVGANATVERSLLDADVRVGPGGTVLDAVCGEGVNLGPAVVVPGGYRDVRVGEQVFPDRRLGAVLGDRVTVGGGAVLDGPLVGPDAVVEAGAYVTGTVPESGRVVR